MRPASLYLAQTWIADLYQQAQRDAPDWAAGRSAAPEHPRAGTASAGSRPLPRAAYSLCWAAIRDRNGHRTPERAVARRADPTPHH